MTDISENEFLDLDDLFSDFVPVDLYSSDAKTLNSGSDSAASLSIDDIEYLFLNDDIEYLLLNDDVSEPLTSDADADAFLSDLLVDSPQTTVDAGSGSDSSAVAVPPDLAVECRNDRDSSHSDHSDEKADHPHHQKGDEIHQVDNDENDPTAKKRKRQLRNRDAAVRSRERKKMYVKDLEMKSRFYEAECRRLEWTLQCVRAENHALQFALHCNNHQAFGSSNSKQESAVLMLESLLLGSLLWVMGIISLFVLPRQLLLILEAALNAGGKRQISLASRKMESNIFGLSVCGSFMKSKRWRGSITRMKVIFRRIDRCLMSIYLSS